MTADYIVKQVEALAKKVGSRDPYIICNELNYKLHYMDLKQRLKAYYFYQSRINNIVIDENVIDLFRPILIAHEIYFNESIKEGSSSNKLKSSHKSFIVFFSLFVMV